MARLTAPLLSLRASGSIGDALVFASWKGIPYARTYVIPENPRTANQVEVRNIFRTLNDMFKRLPITGRAPWLYAVRGLPLTQRNRHIQANVAALQGDANMDDLVMSVAGGQALPPTNVAEVDAGGQTITITADAPSVPTGYTLQAIVAAAVLDGDASDPIVRTTVIGVDGAAPYSVTLDVGTAGDYQTGCWASLTRDADSLPFVSEAVRDQLVVA